MLEIPVQLASKESADSLIDLAGGEHLPWPAGQQEKNVKLHRRQIHRLATFQNLALLRGN